MADAAIGVSTSQVDGVQNELRIVFPGSFSGIRQALIQLQTKLRTWSVGDDIDGTVQIVLAEALNNIAEHAYSESAGVIEVEFQQLEGGLNFRISDTGLPMPDGEVPLGQIEDYPSDPMEMPEGGFGWTLIHDLTTDLSYQRSGPRNILKFRIQT